MDTTIFVSYSGVRAKLVADAIAESADAVFGSKTATIDHEIEAGKNWISELELKLKTATCGILCITRESKLSKWVSYEAGVFRDKALPVYIGTEPENNTSPLSNKQSIVLGDDPENFAVTLMENVSRLIDTEFDGDTFRKRHSHVICHALRALGSLGQINTSVERIWREPIVSSRYFARQILDDCLDALRSVAAEREFHDFGEFLTIAKGLLSNPQKGCRVRALCGWKPLRESPPYYEENFRFAKNVRAAGDSEQDIVHRVFVEPKGKFREDTKEWRSVCKHFSNRDDGVMTSIMPHDERLEMDGKERGLYEHFGKGFGFVLVTRPMPGESKALIHYGVGDFRFRHVDSALLLSILAKLFSSISGISESLAPGMRKWNGLSLFPDRESEDSGLGQSETES